MHVSFLTQEKMNAPGRPTVFSEAIFPPDLTLPLIWNSIRAGTGIEKSTSGGDAFFEADLITNKNQ